MVGSRFLVRLPVIGLALLATACAPSHLSVRDASRFPSEAASETFAVGYESIIEKYIESVSAGELALEGMRGLASIDPALGVQRSAADIMLTNSEEEVARFPAPDRHDVEGWADVTVKTALAGRKASPELAKISVEKIYEAVFDGALSRLDVYSRYAGADQARRNRARREGFGGIGIRFRIDEDLIRVTEIMEETPAARVGIEPGDRITHVDGFPVDGLTVEDIADRLRGPVHTEVEIAVRRSGRADPLTFEIERAHVIPNTVTSQVEDGVLFLEVSRFNQATAKKISRTLKETRLELGDGFRGVVLDMRGNPGGLLKQAVRVADLFLAQGEIVRTRGRHADSLQHYEARGGDLAGGRPVIVLIDGKSASAAEITGAALQDRGRAIVIGTTSYGKGTVQTVIRLPNEGEITLTWSRFVTPSGYFLHQLGVRPTICTSGIDEPGNDPIADLLSHRPEASALMTEWRVTGLNDRNGRRELRASCPAQRRESDYEPKLARRLIDDKRIFARVLGIGDVTAATRP